MFMIFFKGNNDFNLVHFLLIYYCYSWCFCQSYYSLCLYTSNQVHVFITTITVIIIMIVVVVVMVITLMMIMMMMKIVMKILILLTTKTIKLVVADL